MSDTTAMSIALASLLALGLGAAVAWPALKDFWQSARSGEDAQATRGMGF